MATKPVLKSGREDVQALDGVFHAMRGMSYEQQVRVLQFFIASQGLTAERLYPERFK